MITAFRLYGAEDNASDYVDLDDLTYPCQKLTWEYPVVGDTINRPFSSGRHNTRRSVNMMTIEVEGEIFTNSTSAYWSARKALVAKVLPLPVQVPSLYRHSVLRMQIDGDTDWYMAEVQLSSYSIPLATTGAPTVSPFMFSWECNAAYWTNQNTGQLVRL